MLLRSAPSHPVERGRGEEKKLMIPLNDQPMTIKERLMNSIREQLTTINNQLRTSTISIGKLPDITTSCLPCLQIRNLGISFRGF